MVFFVSILSLAVACSAKISVVDNAQSDSASPPVIVFYNAPEPVFQQDGVVVEPFEKRVQEVFKSVEFIDDFMLSVTDEVKSGEGFVASVKKIIQLKKACEAFMQRGPRSASLAKSLSKKVDAVLYKAKELIVREPASLVSCELKDSMADEDILKVLFKDPEEKALFVLKKIKADLKMPFSVSQECQEQGSCYSKGLDDLDAFFSLHRELICLSDKLKKSFLKNLKFAEQQGALFFCSSNLVEYKNPILLLTKSCLESKIGDKYVFYGIPDRTMLANLESKCLPVSLIAVDKAGPLPSLEKEADAPLLKEKISKKISGETPRALRRKISTCKKSKKIVKRKQLSQPEISVVGDNDSSGTLLGDLSEKLPKKRNSKKKQQVVDLDFPKIESLASDAAFAQKVELKIGDLFDVSAPVSLHGHGTFPIEQDVFCEQLASDVQPVDCSAPPIDQAPACCETPQGEHYIDSPKFCDDSVVANQEESVLRKAKASVMKSLENLSKLKY